MNEKFQVEISMVVKGSTDESWELSSKYINTSQDKVVALEYLGSKALMAFMLAYGGDPAMIKNVITKLDSLK